jgi:hypothetical protein
MHGRISLRRVQSLIIDGRRPWVIFTYDAASLLTVGLPPIAERVYHLPGVAALASRRQQRHFEMTFSSGGNAGLFHA